MDKIKRASKRDFFIGQNMIFDLDISEHAKLTYLYLCRCADAEGQCFPSYATISTRCSFSRMTAIRAIQELQKIGLLSVENRKIHKHGKPINTSNLYILHDSPNEGVVSHSDHPSITQIPPLVSHSDHPSITQILKQNPFEQNPLEQNIINTENVVVEKTKACKKELENLIDQICAVTGAEQVQPEGLKPILNLPDGKDRLEKAIKHFPDVVAQSGTISNPVGFLLYMARKNIFPAKKNTNSTRIQTKKTDFTRYPQHQYTVGDLDQLFEPIG